VIVSSIYLQGAYILGSYLLGSIPFGLLVADILGGGKDPREVGSGNIGATNVSRAVGKAGGILTLLLDAGKGFIPLFLARWIFPETQYSLFSMVALAAFLGHIFPLYLKFKGGKGVATAFGIVVFISPVAALLLIVIFIVALVITGYVSIGSLSSAFCFPLLIALLGPSRVYIALALIMALTIFYTHRENIRKLIEGKENRFIRKP
jgi:glycerol-3-phosphate acyltransferase PlsY